METSIQLKFFHKHKKKFNFSLFYQWKKIKNKNLVKIYLILFSFENTIKRIDVDKRPTAKQRFFCDIYQETVNVFHDSLWKTQKNPM